jgi:hypothetical protein
VFLGFDLHLASSSPIRTIVQRSVTYFDQVVGVDPVKGFLPANVTLAQNHPNPFNPSTTIGFIVGQRTPVTLKIFNVLGQEVRTLLSGQIKSAGEHFAVWDGLNNAGAPVSSGVYLYRLQAGDVVKTRRMLFLK